MDQVARLAFIPPTERFGLNANLIQGGHGALDLDDMATVRQQERCLAVKKDFHNSQFFESGIMRAVRPGCNCYPS